MRLVALSLAVNGLCWVLPGNAVAQETVRFDRPVFTTGTTLLCPRQADTVALSRAVDDNDRAAGERRNGASCRMPGPDIRLTVVAKPGLYDPDVEVRIASAPGLAPGLPRGAVWTLKTMLSNTPSAAVVSPPMRPPQ